MFMALQEFLRAIVHLDPTALLYHDSGSRDSSRSDTCDTDLARSKPSSPRGYFDGMPGRPLGTGGGNDDTTQNTHRRQSRPRPSSSGNKPRSPPPRYPGNLPAGESNRGDEGPPTAGLAAAAAAASLQLERDAEEERRAWAQRAGVGRVSSTTTTNKEPLVSPRVGKPAGGERGRSRTSAERSRSARRRRGQEHSTGGDRKTAAAAAAAADAAASEKNETTADVISRAFERYARDRDRDRDRSTEHPQRLHQRSPPGDPFSFALQPGGEERKQQRMPWAGSDNTDDAETDGSSIADEDDSLPSSPSLEQRQHQRRAEKQPPGRALSRTNPDVSSRSGRNRQVAGVNSGDEGGGRSRAHSSSSSGKMGRTAGREDTAERGGGRRFDSSGEDSILDDEKGHACLGGLERERALRQAFDMYDLNGDGFITYLEVGANPQ